jgi:D-alanyl-D-alanine dipeptidase
MRRLLLALTLAACAGEGAQAPAPEAPPPPPAPLAPFIGEYSDGTDTLSVLEEGGALRLVAWGGDADGSSRFTLAGDSTSVPVFTQSGAGEHALVHEGRAWTRIHLGATDGGTFRIVPLRPVAELREEALAASPPEEDGDFLEHDLVEITDMDSTIYLDVRYATTDNFLGTVFYSQPRAFLQRPAAEALVRAHLWLGELGYGLLVFDAYRPWHVTKMFWDATPEHLKDFVADPSLGSRHNRGCAVDLTLYDLATGEEVEMPGGYDEFSPRASPDYPGGTARQRWHRELLRQAMEAQGFAVYAGEWWHFDHADWRRYRLGNATFEELGRD